MLQHPSASFSFTARCRLRNLPGMLGLLASAVGERGGDLRALDIVRVERRDIVRDVTVQASDEAHAAQLVEAIRAIEGVEVLEYTDRTFFLHRGGKISIVSKIPVKTRDDLSMVYTPGVARVCEAIVADRERVRDLTIKRNCVAIVSDGTAVLGLGNIGPEAALPVIEGKCMLFKEFGGVDAFPICLTTQDVDEIVETVCRISPVFGGINLEDISAPRCFEVERKLNERLDIPVFHDDQHGTAVVVTAALINALRVVSKSLDQVRVVVLGTGAAGMACTRLLRVAGVQDIVGVNRHGILREGDPSVVTQAQQDYAAHTNPRGIGGGLDEALEQADVFIGTSAGGLVSREQIQRMADLPVVFALANPDPEIQPELIDDIAAVVATGRSDYPNQINNVLCFPGFFRGLLDCGARDVTEAMKLAAAHAIADLVGAGELHPEYIIPSAFNRAVAAAVAAAVKREAETAGLTHPREGMEDLLHP